MTAIQEELELLSDPPTLRLDGKVVWITGASRGLGRALAFGFAGAGAELLLSARSTDALEDVAAAIRDHGGVAEIVSGSISDSDVIKRATTRINERWGKLDVLVNNAGISPAFVRAEQLENAIWEQTLAVNLSAALHCCQAALPLLEQAGGGSVINVTSVNGTRAHERLIAYASSKAGLEMVTRTLAVEWAPRHIRVNALAPGFLETDLTVALRSHERWNEALIARIPSRRFGRATELVPTALLMASPGTSYMTGTTIYIDGGWTAL